ncbi:hypothetical protein JCM11251_003186 [Rhodosporidiobolus azoricus]
MLEDLEEVDLGGKGWRVDEPARGKVLLVRILTSPLRLSHVQFVVEDRQGRGALLRVEGVPRGVNAEGLWPYGGVFAIPRPLASSCSTSTSSSGYFLRLSSPSPTSLIPLSPFHPILQRRQFPLHPPASSEHRHWLELAAQARNPVEALRAKADDAKKEGKWIHVREALTWAVEAVQGPSRDRIGGATAETRAALLADLAEAHIALALPSIARRYAQQALSSLFSPTSISSAPFAAPSFSAFQLEDRLGVLLARAELSLHHYDAALTALVPLSSSKPVNQLRSLARRLRDEQIAGPSPSRNRELFLRGNVAHLAPLSSFSPTNLCPEIDDSLDHLPPDWVHPSLSLSSLPGKNLSVTATAPIPAGTLLMLSRPLAASFPSREATSFTAGLNAWTRTLDPPSVVETAAQLGWRSGVEAAAGVTAKDGGVGEKVEELWAGADLGRVKEGQGGGVDKQRCEGAVTFNGFVVEDLCSAREPGRGAGDTAKEDEQDEAFFSPLAVYPASIDLPSSAPTSGDYRKAPGPSAINHSCVPSCSYTFLSIPTNSPSPSSGFLSTPTPLFLLRARRPLQPGEELTIDYVSCAHSSLEEREAKLDSPYGHGFTCACGVCDEERTAGRAKREKRATLEGEAWELADRLAGEKGATLARAQLLRLHRRAEQLYSEVEATYGPCPSHSVDASTVQLPRPPLYGPARLRSLLLSLRNRPTEALSSERQALEALGAVFEGDAGRKGCTESPLIMKEAPKVRDTDAVLSALWGAWVCQKEADKGGQGQVEWEIGVRSWLSLARQIEACQAGGAELFDLRFGGWIGRKGLPVEEILWRGDGGVETPR